MKKLKDKKIVYFISEAEKIHMEVSKLRESEKMGASQNTRRKRNMLKREGSLMQKHNNIKSYAHLCVKDSQIEQVGLDWRCKLCGAIFGRVDNAVVHVQVEHWDKEKEKHEK